MLRFIDYLKFIQKITSNNSEQYNIIYFFFIKKILPK